MGGICAYICTKYEVSMSKDPFPLSDCDCDVANNWVLLISLQPFTSSDMKHQRKISPSQSQSLSGNDLNPVPGGGVRKCRRQRRRTPTDNSWLKRLFGPNEPKIISIHYYVYHFLFSCFNSDII